MPVIEYGVEARDRVVDETLNLIDDLDVNQARSILRCFAIDEDNFDTHALATVAETVRATSDRSQSDYNALIHFPDGRTARLNREYLLKSRAASAETERAAQQAAQDAQTTTQPSQTSANISNIDISTTKDGYHDPPQEPALETPMPDLDDLEFERMETRRLIRDGHVTINNYYMHKSPEVKPEPETKPEPKPESKPKPTPKPRPKPKPESSSESESDSDSDWLLCDICDEWYLEEDNVLQEDDRGPCRYHPGQVINYGNNGVWVAGVCITGRAWNCCRRRPKEAGCHPDFHEPADSSESE